MFYVIHYYDENVGNQTFRTQQEGIDSSSVGWHAHAYLLPSPYRDQWAGA